MVPPTNLTLVKYREQIKGISPVAQTDCQLEFPEFPQLHAP